jgi:pyrimidine-specific ribonucleoside hydrolase
VLLFSLDGKTYVQPVAHGVSGMDGPSLSESKFSVTGVDAVEWIYQTIIEQSSPVTIVATGPLTNIAQLLSKYPSIKGRIERIAIMGGSLYSGNITSRRSLIFMSIPWRRRSFLTRKSRLR